MRLVIFGIALVLYQVKILNSKIDEKSIDLIFADPPYNLSGNGLWKGNKTGGDWYMVVLLETFA
jgi:DNA modification methylase